MFQRIILFSIIIILGTGCEKENVDPREYPRIHTYEVTEISESGARFNADILNIGSSPVLEYGFIWDTVEMLKPELCDHVLFEESIKTGGLSYEVRSLLLPGKKYYVKPFIKSPEYYVTGNVVSFISRGSQGPVISGFYPEQGTLGDTVRISGEFFGFLEIHNLVKFDTIQAEVVESSDSLIQVIVPDALTKQESKISITLADKSAVAKKNFVLSGPRIVDFKPKSATIGDTLEIYGESFSNIEEYNLVKFGTVEAQVILSQANKLKVCVPSGLITGESFISVNVAGSISVSDSIFILSTPVLTGCTPIRAEIGDTVVLTGKNFSLITEANNVLFGDTCGQITYTSREKLKVIVPNHKPKFPDITVSLPPVWLKVSVGEQISKESCEFEYDAPVLMGPAVSQGTFGDTLTITGDNLLPFRDEFEIFFGSDIRSEITAINDHELKFIIPDELVNAQQNIRVRTDYYSAEFRSAVTLLPPVIHMVSPERVTFGDPVEITGRNFNPDPSRIRIRINNVWAETVESDHERMLFYIPAEVETTDGTLDIYLSCGSDSLSTLDEEACILEKPVISGIAPLILTNKENRFTISGNFFNPDTDHNIVFFDSVRMNVLSASANQLYVEVPMEKYADQLFSTVDKDVIRLGIGGYNLISDDSIEFRFSGVWTKIFFPGQPRLNATGFSIGEKGYICGGFNGDEGIYNPQPLNDLWEYDPEADEWNRKMDFPGGPRYGMIVFTDGKYAYVGMGRDGDRNYHSDIWRFDPVTNSWNKITDFPATGRMDPIVFIHNNKALIGSGYNDDLAENISDFWEYDIADNVWNQLDSIHVFKTFSKLKSKGSDVISGNGYAAMNYLLASGGGYNVQCGFFKYDLVKGTWENIYSPIYIYNGSLSMNSSIYYLHGVGGGVEKFYEFHTESGSWYYFTSPFDRHIDPVLFNINNYGYYGLGSRTSTGTSQPLYDFLWKFDPSQLRH